MKRYFSGFLKPPRLYGFLLIVVMIMASSAPGKGQRWEVTPYGGYLFAGKVRGNEGELIIENSRTLGLALSYAMDEGSSIELSYLGASSTSMVAQFGAPESESTSFEMAIEYFQLNFVEEMSTSGKIVPMGFLSIGATSFRPRELDFDREWFYTLGLGAGTKMQLSENIGLRAQGRLAVPLFLSAGKSWCDESNDVCLIQLFSFNAIPLIDLGLGIFFRF